MAVTDQQIDEAVPPAGTPSRALTNQLLRDLRDIAVSPPRQIQTFTPTSGQTLEMGQNPRDMTLVILGSAPLASLTVALPAEAVSQIGQIVRVAATVAIDEFTLSNGSVLNAPAQLFDGDAIALQKIEETTWIRVS